MVMRISKCLGGFFSLHSKKVKFFDTLHYGAELCDSLLGVL